MHPGLIGGIIGGVLGIIGGIIGSWASIKNTQSQRERRFVVTAVIISWVVILTFLTLFFVLPMQYRFYLWIPYSVLLPLGIITWNRKQARLRIKAAGKASETQ